MSRNGGDGLTSSTAVTSTFVAVVMGGESVTSRDAHMVSLVETYLPHASAGGEQ